MTRKFSNLCADIKRVCSNIEIWVLYMTIVGLAVALLGLPYMLDSAKDSHKSLALARWTAAKDFWEHCLSQNETAVQPLTLECRQALATPIPPPPLQRRGPESAQHSHAGQGISPAALRASATVTGYFGLLIVCIGLTARSALHLPGQGSARWVQTSRTLEHFSASSLSAFGDTFAHVPVALPRLSTYSSAVPPRRLVTAELRYRAKSHRDPSNRRQSEGEWEAAGHSMSYDIGHAPSGSDIDDQSVLLPETDSEESDTDTADLPVSPVASRELDPPPTAKPEEMKRRARSASQLDNADAADDEDNRFTKPHEKDKGASVAQSPIDATTSLQQTLRQRLAYWRGFGVIKEAEAHKPPERKRVAAHAYQVGKTIVVEDEDGEVIKEYTLPAIDEARKRTYGQEQLRKGMQRMGAYLDVAKKAEKPAESAESAEEIQRSEVDQNEPDDDGLRLTISRAQEYGWTGLSRRAGTDMAGQPLTLRSGRRLSTREFLQQMNALNKALGVLPETAAQRRGQGLAAVMTTEGEAGGLTSDSAAGRRKQILATIPATEGQADESDAETTVERRRRLLALYGNGGDNDTDDEIQWPKVSLSAVQVQPQQPIPPPIKWDAATSRNQDLGHRVRSKSPAPPLGVEIKRAPNRAWNQLQRLWKPKPVHRQT